MRTRKILVILAVLMLTFVSCFVTGCGGADANIGGYNDEAAVQKAQSLIDQFIEKNQKSETLHVPLTVKATSKVIDVSADDFTPAMFGTYEGTFVEGSQQYVYMETLIADANYGRQGRIPAGRVVLVNFGTRADESVGYFLYIGNKQFVQLFGEDTMECKDSLIPKLFYAPTGYRLVPCNHMGGGAYLLRVLEKIAV